MYCTTDFATAIIVPHMEFYFVHEWNADDRKQKCKSLPNCRYAMVFCIDHLCAETSDFLGEPFIKQTNERIVIIKKSLHTLCAPNKYLVHLNGVVLADSVIPKEMAWISKEHALITSRLSVSWSTLNWSTFPQQLMHLEPQKAFRARCRVQHAI